jgi:hypothetical protein
VFLCVLVLSRVDEAKTHWTESSDCEDGSWLGVPQDGLRRVLRLVLNYRCVQIVTVDRWLVGWLTGQLSTAVRKKLVYN